MINVWMITDLDQPRQRVFWTGVKWSFEPHGAFQTDCLDSAEREASRMLTLDHWGRIIRVQYERIESEGKMTTFIKDIQL